MPNFAEIQFSNGLCVRIVALRSPNGSIPCGPSLAGGWSSFIETGPLLSWRRMGRDAFSTAGENGSRRICDRRRLHGVKVPWRSNWVPQRNACSGDGDADSGNGVDSQ